MPYGPVPSTRGRAWTRLGVRANSFPDTDPRGRFYAQRQAALARRQANISRLRAAAPVPMAVPAAVARAPEVKFFDVTVANASWPLIATVAGAEPTTAFAGITELNDILQGAGAYQRIGQKLTMKSVAFKCSLELGGTPPVMGNGRIMLVYDRQPNGAFPSISDLLSINVSTAPIFTSGLNMSKKSRFSILCDKYIDLDTDALGTASVVLFRNNINLETEYSATAGTIADITTGALFLIAFGTYTNFAMKNATARIRFYDN